MYHKFILSIRILIKFLIFMASECAASSRASSSHAAPDRSGGTAQGGVLRGPLLPAALLLRACIAILLNVDVTSYKSFWYIRNVNTYRVFMIFASFYRSCRVLPHDSKIIKIR